MNEDQRQQLVDLIDKLESDGLSKKEISTSSLLIIKLIDSEKDELIFLK